MEVKTIFWMHSDKDDLDQIFLSLDKTLPINVYWEGFIGHPEKLKPVTKDEWREILNLELTKLNKKTNIPRNLIPLPGYGKDQTPILHDYLLEKKCTLILEPQDYNLYLEAISQNQERQRVFSLDKKEEFKKEVINFMKNELSKLKIRDELLIKKILMDKTEKFLIVRGFLHKDFFIEELNKNGMKINELYNTDKKLLNGLSLFNKLKFKLKDGENIEEDLLNDLFEERDKYLF